MFPHVGGGVNMKPGPIVATMVAIVVTIVATIVTRITIEMLE